MVFSCVFVGLQFRCFVFCACWVLLLGLVLVCFWCWLCFGYSWLIVLGMLFDFYYVCNFDYCWFVMVVLACLIVFL